MAARRSQTQYKDLTERLEKLEAENARLLGLQTEEMSQAAREKGEAQSTRQALALVQAELLTERGNVAELSESLEETQGELCHARARAAQWQQKANQFADDSEALQARLHQVSEQQRSSVRSVYSELERRIGGALERSKSSEPRSDPRRRPSPGAVQGHLAAESLPQPLASSASGQAAADALVAEPEPVGAAQQAMAQQPALN
eukprot:1088417-Prymnesium_polylepis.1